MAISSDYRIEIDSVDAAGWSRLIADFDDANIYQTWSYEAVRSGPKHLSHFLLRQGDDVVAAAQVRLARLPLTRIGIAYVRWGPLWRRRGRIPDPQVFARALRGLRDEYACRRGLSLRLLPLVTSDERERFAPLFEQEAFTRLVDEPAQRTLLMSLSPSLEDLRKGLDQKWRNCLNRAEKNGLTVVEGNGDALFASFIEIYRQMHARKKFLEPSNVNEFRIIQRDLPDPLKMRIAIANCDGMAAAGVICSRIGDMGVYLYGATSDAGLSTKASYLLQWRTIAWLKQQGAACYNLHGINPASNPGTYHFKAGLCGRNGKDVHYLGVYDTADDAATRILVAAANSARLMYRKGRLAMRALMAKAS